MIGTQLRLVGLARASSAHRESLQAAQFVAQLLGGDGATISINDIRRFICGLANASGAVFAGDEWQAVGWEMAEHAAGHCRAVRTWRLR